MAYTILLRFRNIVNWDISKISDALVRTDYMAPALARYNSIMGTSLTITNDTTSDTHADEAVAWLASAMAYAEEHTTKRDSNRGGLFIWETWEQQAYKVMHEKDQTKFDFAKNLGVFYPKIRSEVWVNAYIRDNAADSEDYGE